MGRESDDFLVQAAEIDSLDDLAGALRQLRRRHARRRSDTQLTYRELALKSGYAHGVIGDYFSGKRLPPTDRLDVLAGLLGATGEERGALATARDRVEERQRRPVAPAENAAIAWRTLPRDVFSFTGREHELSLLVGDDACLDGVVRIHAIGGMAGIGKTAFAVHAAHLLADRFPDGQLFVPLHGHTPGQDPADPADVLARLLQGIGVAAQQIPADLEARAALWRDRLAGKRLLLVLDDAAGHGQVQPILPGTAGCLVLITSRRRLTALEGARAITLGAFSPRTAGELLVRLAGRPGLDPDDVAVAEICRLCGHLPLAVGMLARQLHHHPTWAPADLAADLTTARDNRLELMHAENLSVAAAFDLSYRDLSLGEQRLFRHLSWQAGPDVDVYAAAALNGTGIADARRGLEALYDHHLLEEPARGRYRFHDLIREHARVLAAADPAEEEDAAAGRVLDYYVHAASAASQHLARRAPVARVDPPSAAPEFTGREQAAGWMDAEHGNLDAATRSAAAHQRLGHVVALAAALNGYLLTQGHWHQAVAIHRLAADAARRSGDRPAEASALVHLGVAQRLTGDFPAATGSITRSLELSESRGSASVKAHALNELGVTQYLTGDYQAATGSITDALELCRSLGDREAESGALNDLGMVQQAAGQYQAAHTSFTQALAMHRDLGDRLWEANALNNIGAIQRLTGQHQVAAASHRRALDIYRALGNRFGEARALSNLGAVQCLLGDHSGAAASQQRALRLYRALGNQAGEAESLNHLGAVQCLLGDYEEAAVSHRHALRLYRERGVQLGEAEVLNSLGELALATGSPADAATCHEQALAIATAIAAPVEQARALDGLGRSHRHAGQSDQAAARLSQALGIYRQIGSPDAQRVEASLQELGRVPAAPPSFGSARR